MAFEKADCRYYNSEEAARYLHVSRSMLAKRRLSGDGPRYAKLGKLVVYEIADLDKWIADHRHHSTSEYIPMQRNG